MQITLAQFEKIDGLFRTCLARPNIEQIVAHPLASREYLRATYFRPEWELLDLCIEAIGYDAAMSFGSATHCAASLLTDCLVGKYDVLDVEAEPLAA